MTDSY